MKTTDSKFTATPMFAQKVLASLTMAVSNVNPVLVSDLRKYQWLWEAKPKDIKAALDYLRERGQCKQVQWTNPRMNGKTQPAWTL